MATDRKQLEAKKRDLEKEFEKVKAVAVEHEKAIQTHQKGLADCSAEMARLQGKHAMLRELLGEK